MGRVVLLVLVGDRWKVLLLFNQLFPHLLHLPPTLPHASVLRAFYTLPTVRPPACALPPYTFPIIITIHTVGIYWLLRPGGGIRHYWWWLLLLVVCDWRGARASIKRAMLLGRGRCLLLGIAVAGEDWLLKKQKPSPAMPSYTMFPTHHTSPNCLHTCLPHTFFCTHTHPCPSTTTTTTSHLLPTTTCLPACGLDLLLPSFSVWVGGGWMVVNRQTVAWVTEGKEGRGRRREEGRRSWRGRKGMCAVGGSGDRTDGGAEERRGERHGKPIILPPRLGSGWKISNQTDGLPSLPAWLAGMAWLAAADQLRHYQYPPAYLHISI